MNARTNKRKRRYTLWQMLVTLALIAFVMATDLAGALPGNPYSAELRQVLSNGLPVDFVNTVNQELVSYTLPTLPPAVTVTSAVLALVATPVPPVTAPPALPTKTEIPPTAEVIETPSPVEPMPEMANEWYISTTDGGRIIITIEKQGDTYIVANVIDSASSSFPLVSQNWDGKTLKWSMQNVEGNILSFETIDFNVCGCGDLGYLLNTTAKMTSPTGEPIFALDLLPLYPVAYPAPNPDYSGSWTLSRTSESGNETIVIEKLGDVYIVASLTGDDGADRTILSQSWDGSTLSWVYTVGNEEITMKTLGVSQGGFLLLTGTYKNDPLQIPFDLHKLVP
ncbi:MAG: hypothetical protein IPO22_14025 [Anaerolineales bacterium]|nr:hypothetical protein [Anaerolineales bacterium]